MVENNALLEARGEAVIRKHLPRELHLALIEETHRMLEAGAKIEEILWLLSDSGGMADHRPTALAALEEDLPSALQFLRQVPDAFAGKMVVVYIGSEGAFCQVWESILSLEGGAC